MRLRTVSVDRIEATVDFLDNIPTGDPEAAHGMADELLLDFVPDEIRLAYKRVIQRSRWWAHA